MIEKTLKTTTGKLLVKMPSALNEVTLGQMMAIQDKPGLNDLDAISILSGIPAGDLQNIRDINDLQAFGDTVLSLSHQIKHLYNCDDIPAKVTFQLDKKTTTVNVMHNLSVEPAGAFMAASDIIVDEISAHIKQYGEENWQQYFNPSLKACCQVLAHYFYCRATGEKYNEYKAEEFCTQVKKLRVTEALPIAKHFFTCYPNLSRPKTSFWHRLRQFWRKKQVYTPSRNLSTSIP